MVRLLIGAPLHSDGKVTIVSLAVEAGLRRNIVVGSDSAGPWPDAFAAIATNSAHGCEVVGEAGARGQLPGAGGLLPR